ncbi:MAG: hypothetical protein H7070_12120 [Saprospiraceae bacterium]|nr:hypothetical protein [Pyrinomonadaceae bacterium]
MNLYQIMPSSTERHECCAAGPKNLGRRIRLAAKWFVPGALLVLIPKCPLCIVAYVAMVSGIGLSVSAASSVRIALIFVSWSGLFYLAAGSVLRLKRRSHENNFRPNNQIRIDR